MITEEFLDRSDLHFIKTTRPLFRSQLVKHLAASRLKLKDKDEELKFAKRDLKQMKRHVQTYEVLASSGPLLSDRQDITHSTGSCAEDTNQSQVTC